MSESRMTVQIRERENDKLASSHPAILSNTKHIIAANSKPPKIKLLPHISCEKVSPSSPLSLEPTWQAPSAAPGRNSLELSQPPGYLATTGSFESGGSRQAYEVGDCLDILTFGIL